MNGYTKAFNEELVKNFCNANNIKWMCFNSFYQTPAHEPQKWVDLGVREELNRIYIHPSVYSTSQIDKRQLHHFSYEDLWNTVAPKNFYKKDIPNNTFKSFMQDTVATPYCGWHPSPESHQAWAKELQRFIIEQKLL
jgi:hypothetical protein